MEIFEVSSCNTTSTQIFYHLASDKVALDALTKALEEDIADKLKELKLDNEQELLNSLFAPKQKIKRKAPTTRIEKQCSKLCKSGKKCTTARCYEDSCWAHLNKDLRDEYRKIKASNKLG